MANIRVFARSNAHYQMTVCQIEKKKKRKKSDSAHYFSDDHCQISFF